MLVMNGLLHIDLHRLSSSRQPLQNDRLADPSRHYCSIMPPLQKLKAPTEYLLLRPQLTSYQGTISSSTALSLSSLHTFAQSFIVI